MEEEKKRDLKRLITDMDYGRETADDLERPYCKKILLTE